MTKELNFNKADIQAGNMDFYRWQEEMKPGSMKTWFAYFMRGGHSTYIGLISGDKEYQFTFHDMGFDEARRHLKFKHLRTNLDDGLTMFDRAMLKDCRRIAENAWKKDCGLGYQVAGQVTSQVTSQVKEQGR